MIKIRWLPSLHVTLNNFDKGWSTLYHDLGKISTNPKFPKKVQLKADNIRKAITNKNVVLYNFFFWDLTQLMADWTQFAQKRRGMLIEQIERKNSVISSLMLMKDQDGEHLKGFYEEIVCILPGGIVYSKNAPLGICKEEKFYNAEKVLWRTGFLDDESFDLGKTTNTDIAEDNNEMEDDNEEEVVGGKDISTLRLKNIREEILDSLIDEVNRYVC